MKPRIGDIVLVHGRNHYGSLEHPAIVTSLQENGTITAMLVPDGGTPYSVTAVEWCQEPTNGTSTEMKAYHRSEEISEETEEPELTEP